MFKIGQRVICVDDTMPDDGCGGEYTPCRVRKDEVYTIRGTHTEPHIEGYGVFLEEVANPPIVWADGSDHEWPFDAARFRPVEEREPVFTAAAAVLG